MKICLFLFTFFFLQSCFSQNFETKIIPAGNTVLKRISPPEGYQWIVEPHGSYGSYLQNLNLLPHKSPILDYTGTPISNQNDHVAIVDFDTGKRDLQQCADAVIRVRAEYLFASKSFDDIGFHFTSGDYFAWDQYKQGYRAEVSSNNKVKFVQKAQPNSTYASFRKYLDAVYIYAGTISLNKETIPVKDDRNIKSGDIIITPGSPGHVVFIIGRAKNAEGKIIFLLAEGYTPAQSIHILTSPFSGVLNPWYELSVEDQSITTARYYFNSVNIRTFK
ncbi:MAG: DUF4846 domain-containing protein [Cyclobacteriaceae bacterium]|nr:DUF4846 domain-containing protein [Cyclobacteriaceae bacterium]